MFAVPCCIFILINNKEGFSIRSRSFFKKKILVDCSINKSKLFFVNPTLWYQMLSERCLCIFRHWFFWQMLLPGFYSNCQSGETPQTLRYLKLLIFCWFAILSMLSFIFVKLNKCYLMHLKRGKLSLLCWLDKQLLRNVSATIQHSYFDQQSEEILQAL